MSDWQKVKQIFNSVIERSPGERREYLDDACAGDPDLRRKVDELLDSYDSTFLEAPGTAPENAEPGRLKPGETLGRYEVECLLGVGGMGEVYLAKDLSLDRKVAIKVLNQKYESSESNTRRFIQEAKAASALNHPNILTIHEIGKTGDSHYIVSEYVDGITLRTLSAKGKLPLKVILHIAAQIAEALSAAHGARIIHRDIKPDNIVVRSDEYVKILDFGLAKLLRPAISQIDEDGPTLQQQATGIGVIMGTVSYMSPEQARGETVDERTDIFSLGSVLYEMIAGRTPFAGASTTETLANLINREPPRLSELASGVPEELQRMISKMLRKDPNERYQTMKGLLADLKELTSQAGAGSAFERMSVPESDKVTAVLPLTTGDARFTTAASTGPVARRSRSFFMIGAAATLMLSAIGIAWYWQQRQQDPATRQTAGVSPAYDLYIRGKVKAGSDDRQEIEGAITLLEQAVAQDPNYAEAYALLAVAYNTKSFQFAPVGERKQLNENAEVALEKSLRLKPNSPEGHFARAVLLWTHPKRFPHEQTIQEHKRAIALDPNFDEAHHRLGMVYTHVGLLDEAFLEIRKALEINPNNTMARFRLGTTNVYAGNFETAISIFKTIPSDVSPLLVERATADALVHLGRLKEAETIVDDYLKANPQDPGGNVTSVKAILYAKAGRKTDAEATIQRAVEIGRGFGHFHHTAYNIASAYAILNQPEEALKWLQDAADDGFPCYSYFAIDHNLDNIRTYPPFVDFMKSLKARMEHFRTVAADD